MAEKKYKIVKRREREYVYLIQNVYNPEKKHTDKITEYCGVFLGYYDQEGNPKYCKARESYAIFEIICFKDTIDTFLRGFVNENRTNDFENISPIMKSFLHLNDVVYWSDDIFKKIKKMYMIYFCKENEKLNYKFEIYLPIDSKKVYCRFYNSEKNKSELKCDYNIEAIYGESNNAFFYFSDGNGDNQVVLSYKDLRVDNKLLDRIGNLFIYTTNKDENVEIKKLAKSFELIEKTILPYLANCPNTIKKSLSINKKSNLNALSNICTSLLNILLELQIPDAANCSTVINDLLATNAKFIQLEKKWILLEERISTPVL